MEHVGNFRGAVTVVKEFGGHLHLVFEDVVVRGHAEQGHDLAVETAAAHVHHVGHHVHVHPGILIFF